jgi:hypothetical protein
VVPSLSLTFTTCHTLPYNSTNLVENEIITVQVLVHLSRAQANLRFVTFDCNRAQHVLQIIQKSNHVSSAVFVFFQISVVVCFKVNNVDYVDTLDIQVIATIIRFDGKNGRIAFYHHTYN